MTIDECTECKWSPKSPYLLKKYKYLFELSGTFMTAKEATFGVSKNVTLFPKSRLGDNLNILCTYQVVYPFESIDKIKREGQMEDF